MYKVIESVCGEKNSHEFEEMKDAIVFIKNGFELNLRELITNKFIKVEFSAFTENGMGTVAYIYATRVTKPTANIRCSWKILKEEKKEDVLYTVDTLPSLPFEVRIGDSRLCVTAATPTGVVLSTMTKISYVELAQYKFPDGNPCVHIHHLK